MAHKTNDFLAKLPSAHRALMRWYKLHGRHHLPWRNTRDPYAIYLSEIMLQQTQVKTVLERYYTPFLKRFPSLKKLAAAELQDVLKAWEGLGYYSRAANLHKAAQQAGGVLPPTPEALMALPGIGRNTAHAVACFAFGAVVPIMEANVKRVLCRVFALKVAEEKTLWQKAKTLLDRKNAYDYNQAMMDIGAMVCTKRNPKCAQCPLAVICKGSVNPEAYPAAIIKKAVPVRKKNIVVFEDKYGRYLVAQRATRFLGGLYGFMEVEREHMTAALEGKSYALARPQLIGAVMQAYSHFILEANVYLIPLKTTGLSMVSLKEIEQLPLSKADLKVVELLRALA